MAKDAAADLGRNPAVIAPLDINLKPLALFLRQGIDGFLHQRVVIIEGELVCLIAIFSVVPNPNDPMAFGSEHMNVPTLRYVTNQILGTDHRSTSS